MAFVKTGAPERGVRISEEGEWIEDQPTNEEDFENPQEEEIDEDAVSEG